MHAFLDNSLTIAWMKDTQGRYVYVSPNYENRFLKGRLEWQGKTDFDLWPMASARQFHDNDQHVLSTKVPLEVIEQAEEPDGSISSWQNSKFPFQDDQGEWYIGAMGVDITERVRQKVELNRYRDNLDLQYRHLLAATPGGYLLVSKTGKIEDVNEAYVLLSGYSREELLSLSVSDLEAKESPEQVQNHIIEAIIDKNSVFETQHRAKNGQLLEVEVSINYQDRTEKFVTFIKDTRVRNEKLQQEILARKESELRLQRAIKAEEELLRVYEKTSREIGRELHDDLGQQLTALALLSEVLSQDLRQENSQLCKSSSKITDRLNFAVSRVRQLSHRLCPVSSDYNSIIDMLNILVQPSVALHNLAISFHYDPALGGAYFDYVHLPIEEFNIQLFRIAQEAINNAIKHSQCTHIELLLHRDINGDVFEIRDDGKGLSANHAIGLGMESMSFRAKILKANIAFNDNDQGGLSISICVPRSRNQDETI